MKYIVYMHTNKLNGKSYIGITGKSLKGRFNEHCADAFRQGCRPKFQRAIRKYGRDVWVSTILHVTDTAEKAKVLEVSEIAARGTLKNGYNSTAGGDGAFGYIHRKDSIAKRAGVNQVQAKAYIVTFPDGHEEEILNLTAFCREHNLDHRKAHVTTYDLGRKHKGFRFRETGTAAQPVAQRSRGEKLSDEQRAEIARLAVAGILKNREIAAKFGVSDVTVTTIKRKALNGNSVEGKNKGAKFIVTHPDGREELILNLSEFCRIAGISYASAAWCSAVPGRRHQGYGFRKSGAVVEYAPRPTGWLSDEAKMKLMTAAREGMKPAEIARVYGTTITTACAYAKRAALMETAL